MPTLTPVRIDQSPAPGAISERCFADHYRLYEGYVAKYNELYARLAKLRAKKFDQSSTDVESLKGDLTYLLGAIKNHELFFGILGESGKGPDGALAEALARDFGSVEQYLADLKQTAQRARGWAWTAYDLDHGYLFNYQGIAQNALPVWNTVPIVAIDLYGHAYFYDFGGNKTAYIDALLQGIAWDRVAAHYERAVRQHG